MTKGSKNEVSVKRGYEIGDSNSVIQMGLIRISGDVIPPSWRQVITRENGKPHDPAINILADIVYWHRPIEITDNSGIVIEYRKRFIGDWLQRSYKDFMEKFSYSRNQVKQAIDKLADLGVIIIEFRNPVIDGQKLGNVLYINLEVKKLIELTFPKELVDQFATLFNLNLGGVLDLNSIPLLNLNSIQIQRLLNTQTTDTDSITPQDGAGIDSSSKDNQPKEPNPDTKKGKLALLEIWFGEQFNLELPDRATARQRGAAATRWWAPLRSMLNQTDYDLELTKELILECKTYLMGINKNIIFSAPQTLENTFPGVIARRKQKGLSRIENQYQNPPNNLDTDIKTIWTTLPFEARAYIVNNPNDKARYRSRLYEMKLIEAI